VKNHPPHQEVDQETDFTQWSSSTPAKHFTMSSLEDEILAAKSGPSVGVVVSLLIITVVISYFAYDSAPLVGLIAWCIAMIIMMVMRVTLQEKLSVDKNTPLQKRMRSAFVLTAATGVVHASSFLFFPEFTLTERTIQTIMMLGLTNGSISTNSGYRPFFLAYSLPITIGLTLAWGLSNFGGANNIVAFSVLTLNLVYFGVMYSNASSHFRLFKESYDIREQQAELNSKLADKNSELDSALNQALEARQEADMANKSKTRFLASASHDLRQPTHALSLLAGVLTRQELDKKCMSIALDIHQASQNLQALMTGLLDISKLDAGLMVPKIETIDLSWLITRVCNEFEAQAYDKGLRLLFISNYGAASTRSDPQLTERILRNLVSNAVKYTDKGQVEVILEKSDGKWKISIKDTGCGIDEKERERIFEEFYQVGNSHRDSANGLGLGLAIVKRLSDTLNLQLNCESEVNIGSSFSFSLPIFDDDTSTQKEVISKNTLAGVHILCVDDEKDIRRAMSLVFELLECSFDLVDGIDNAVLAAKKRKPDIVLADYRLIGQRNGIDTIHAIREMYPNIPALLVTGDTSPERLILANKVGIEMLHKPLTMEKLVQAVGEKVEAQ
jgi:signal transduction histidine kinase